MGCKLELHELKKTRDDSIAQEKEIEAQIRSHEQAVTDAEKQAVNATKALENEQAASDVDHIASVLTIARDMRDKVIKKLPSAVAAVKASERAVAAHRLLCAERQATLVKVEKENDVATNAREDEARMFFSIEALLKKVKAEYLSKMNGKLSASGASGASGASAASGASGATGASAASGATGLEMDSLSPTGPSALVDKDADSSSPAAVGSRPTGPRGLLGGSASSGGTGSTGATGNGSPLQAALWHSATQEKKNTIDALVQGEKDRKAKMAMQKLEKKKKAEAEKVRVRTQAEVAHAQHELKKPVVTPIAGPTAGEMEAVKAAAASASAEIESLQDDETVRQLTSEISSTGSGDAMSASGSAEAATGSGDATSASGSAEAERVERDLETVMSTGSTGSGTLGSTGEEGEGSSASSSSFVEIQEREELLQEMKNEVQDEESAMGLSGAASSSSGSTGATGGTGGRGPFELPLGDQRALKRILMAARAKKAAKQAAEAVVRVKQAGGTPEDIAKVSGFANRAMSNAQEAVIRSQEEINHMETSTKIERATEKERKEEAKKAADKAMQKVKEEAKKAANKLKAEEEARKALETEHKSEMQEKELKRQQEEKKKREEIAAVKAAEQKEKSDRTREAEENKKELKKLRKQLADNEKKEEKREKEDIRAKKAEAKRHAAELLKAAASAKRKEIMEEEHQKEMERAREAARSAREKQAEDAEKDRTSTLERVNEEAKKERARAFEEGEAAEQKRARERAIARLEANTKQAKEKLIADAEVAEQNALAKSKTTLGRLAIGAGLDGNSLLNANAAAHQAAQTKIQADHATALSIIHVDNADALVKRVKMKDTFVKQEKEKIEKYEHDIVKDSLAREIAAREKLAREKSQLKNLMSFDDDDDDDDGVGKPSGTSGNTGSADAIETARTEGSRSRNGVGSAGGARVTKASTEAMQKAIMDKERKEVTDAEIEQAMRVAAELARARAEKKAAILQARRANMRLIDAVKKSVEAKDDLADAQQRLKDLTFSYGQVKASQSHGADQLKTDKALIDDAQERVELASAAVRESAAAAEAAGTADKNAQNRVAAARELLALAEESAEREEKRLKSAIMTTGTGMTGPSSALAHGLALAKELTGPTGNDGRKRTLADLALDTSETAASGSTGITGASGAGDTFVGEDAREKLALEALGVEKGAHRPRDAADALAVFNVGQTPTGGASPNRTEGVLTKTTVEKRTMGVLVSDESATGHPGEVLIKPLPAGRGFPGMNQIGPEVEQEVLDQMAKEREDDEDIKLLTKATESARKDAENAKNAAIALAAQKAKAENAVEESNVALDNALVGGANET